VFYRRYVLGESEEKARLQSIHPAMEMYVRCYFETDRGQLRLARLRLRRAIGRALRIDKIVGYLSKLIR
jgi:hypothetical protein